MNCIGGFIYDRALEGCNSDHRLADRVLEAIVWVGLVGGGVVVWDGGGGGGTLFDSMVAGGGLGKLGWGAQGALYWWLGVR